MCCLCKCWIPDRLLCKRFTLQVEEALHTQALKRSNASGQRKSGREYVSQVAAEGAGMLLRRWPEGLGALKELENSPLPEAIRREAWLAKIREMLRPLVGAERSLRISDSDNEITALVTKAIREAGTPDLEPLLPQIKAAMSHMHSDTDKGKPDSHLILLSLPMAWLISGRRKAMGEVDAATVYEAVEAIRITTGHSSLLGGWECSPKHPQWQIFVSAADKSLAAFDPELHAMLSTIAANGGKGTAQMASGQPLHRPRAQVWEFATSDVHMAGGAGSELGPVFYPLVGRLFVGIMASFEASCFVWDLMFLHGFEILPHLCASYLVTLRNTLTTALSAASNTLSLERTLNLTVQSVHLDAMQRTVETHVMPWLRNRLLASQQQSAASKVQQVATSQQAPSARRKESAKHSIGMATYLELAGAKAYVDKNTLKIKVPLPPSTSPGSLSPSRVSHVSTTTTQSHVPAPSSFAQSNVQRTAVAHMPKIHRATA